ncbi:unnamed protein product [Lasius platythorax]
MRCKTRRRRRIEKDSQYGQGQERYMNSKRQDLVATKSRIMMEERIARVELSLEGIVTRKLGCAGACKK